MCTSGASLVRSQCECLVTSNFYYIYARWSLPLPPHVSPVGTSVHLIALVLSRCILSCTLSGLLVLYLSVSVVMIVRALVRAYFSHPLPYSMHLSTPLYFSRASTYPCTCPAHCMHPICASICTYLASYSAPIISTYSASYCALSVHLVNQCSPPSAGAPYRHLALNCCSGLSLIYIIISIHATST